VILVLVLRQLFGTAAMAKKSDRERVKYAFSESFPIIISFVCL